MIGPYPICFNCKHFYNGVFGFKCNAFPNKIPEEILSGKNDHNKPLKGQDNGIVFKKK